MKAPLSIGLAVHRGGQNDLGTGGAGFLEQGDEPLQRFHVAAAHLHNEAVAAGEVEALQHLGDGGQLL